jgi:hypothetical protein
MWVDKISLVQFLGIVNFILILFQLSSGRRWIRVRSDIHRKVGLVLVVTASVHGLLAMMTAN